MNPCSGMARSMQHAFSQGLRPCPSHCAPVPQPLSFSTAAFRYQLSPGQLEPPFRPAWAAPPCVPLRSTGFQPRAAERAARFLIGGSAAAMEEENAEAAAA